MMSDLGHHPHAVIKNQKSGLVMDASEYEVKIQAFTGLESQLWKLKPTKSGQYMIINKLNKNALDIQSGATSGNKLITYTPYDTPNQQWFINSDNTIVNAVGNLAIEIQGDGTPGSCLIVSPKNGGVNQQFIFEY